MDGNAFATGLGGCHCVFVLGRIWIMFYETKRFVIELEHDKSPQSFGRKTEVCLIVVDRDVIQGSNRGVHLRRCAHKKAI